MNILLDTHYLLWAFLDTHRIEKRLMDIILAEDNEIFYSQASLWEISIKYNLGKLVFEGISPEDLYREIENSFLRCRTFTNDELISFYRLPIEHRDPFDRILVWQAITSDYFFLSSDGKADAYTKYGLKILH